jgi:hypothetical protein
MLKKRILLYFCWYLKRGIFERDHFSNCHFCFGLSKKLAATSTKLNIMFQDFLPKRDI